MSAMSSLRSPTLRTWAFGVGILMASLSACSLDSEKFSFDGGGFSAGGSGTGGGGGVGATGGGATGAQGGTGNETGHASGGTVRRKARGELPPTGI